MPERDITLAASKFKATCLDILKQLETGALRSVTVTRRGKPVAKMEAAKTSSKLTIDGIFGCLRGTVTIPPGVDITAPLDDIPEPHDPFFDGPREDDAA